MKASDYTLLAFSRYGPCSTETVAKVLDEPRNRISVNNQFNVHMGYVERVSGSGTRGVIFAVTEAGALRAAWLEDQAEQLVEAERSKTQVRLLALRLYRERKRTFASIARETGLTVGQVAGFVYRSNRKKALDARVERA